MKIRWFSLDEARAEMSRAQYVHLADNGSLTRRVRQGCSGEFKVRLIEHKKLMPDQDEASILGLSESILVLSRCVYLCCGDRPQVFAKTILGLTEKNKKLAQRLSALGENSLGSILFRDPLATKIQMHLAFVSCNHNFFRDAKLADSTYGEPIWVRRSLYNYQGSELIVYEAYVDFPIV